MQYLELKLSYVSYLTDSPRYHISEQGIVYDHLHLTMPDVEATTWRCPCCNTPVVMTDSMGSNPDNYYVDLINCHRDLDRWYCNKYNTMLIFMHYSKKFFSLNSSLMYIEQALREVSPEMFTW